MSETEFELTAPSAIEARIDRGEVVVSTEAVPAAPVPKAIAWAVIEARPERVWSLIADPNRYTQTMIGLKHAEVLSRDGDLVRVRTTLKMPFPLKDLSATTDGLHTVRDGSFYQRKWSLVEGDYQANSGSWTFVPFRGNPERTLVRYEVFAIPNIRIPKKLQEMATSRTMPKLIDHLRAQVR